MSVQIKAHLPSSAVHSSDGQPPFLSTGPRYSFDLEKVLGPVAFAGLAAAALGLSAYCGFLCFKELLISTLLFGMLLMIRRMSVPSESFHQS